MGNRTQSTRLEDTEKPQVRFSRWALQWRPKDKCLSEYNAGTVPREEGMKASYSFYVDTVNIPLYSVKLKRYLHLSLSGMAQLTNTFL